MALTREELITLINTNQDVTNADVSEIEDFSYLCEAASNSDFNQNVSGWNVSSATNMKGMFKGCNKFEQNLDSWDVSNVTDMSEMFYGCSKYFRSLNSWDVSNVTDMNRMFRSCSRFSGNISSWNVSNVLNFERMFFSCFKFNSDISNWVFNTNLTSIRSMLYNCSIFNRPIGNWDVSNITDMYQGLGNCRALNQDLSSWDVSNVTNMQQMFTGCREFNQDLSAWDVSNVEIFYSMFFDCDKFNQDIGMWDVSNATNMFRMFYNSAIIYQNLTYWDVRNVTNYAGFADNSPMQGVVEVLPYFGQNIEPPPYPEPENKSFTYTLPSINGTLTDFVLQMKESDFPPEAIDGSTNSIGNGQGIRVYTNITKTTRLPLQIVKCDTGASPEVLMYIKMPSASTGSTVYIVDEGGSQPANDEQYGRNEVWSDYWIVSHDCYSEDDETGNVDKAVVHPIERKVEGQTIAGGFDCGGHLENFVTTYSLVDKQGQPLAMTSDFTVQAWGKIDTTSTDSLGQGIVTLYDQSLSDSARLMADNDPDDWGIYDTEDSWLRSGQVQELGEYKNTVMTYNSGNRYIYYQGDLKAQSPTSGTLNNFASGFLFIGRGRQLNGQELWDGSVSDVRLSKQPLSNERIATDFDNMNSVTSWGTASSWVVNPTDDTNNLQYNGQNVVDVMYADSNGTLQQVELNMGGTLVWAKGTS